jgi:hypothetical protein
MSDQWVTYLDLQAALDAAGAEPVVETAIDETPCPDEDLEWINRMMAVLKNAEPPEREADRLSIELFDLADDGAFDPEKERRAG